MRRKVEQPVNLLALHEFAKTVLESSLAPYLPEGTTMTLALVVPDPGKPADVLLVSDEPDLTVVRDAITGLLAYHMADAQALSSDGAPARLH